MTDAYIELHASSAFSFLAAAALPEDLVARAAELDMSAIALLDRDGVYGAPRFHMAAQKAGGIRAHIGAEITRDTGGRLPLLVENRAGYQNLCRLVTRMKLRAGKKGEGAATDADLREYAPGLIALADFESAPQLVEIFGSRNVYAEIQRHFSRQEEARNQATVAVATSLRLPVIATGGVRYARPEQRELLDVFTCIRNKCKLETAGRLLESNAERYLKSAKEMARLFSDIPQAIANTGELSARLDFTLADLGYEFPRYPVASGDTMAAFLWRLTDAGARSRYRPYHERARAQIERELKLIVQLGLEGYFLIVWDIVRFCREQGILAQGRGSAANSAVCYALGITAVDPIAMELLFERFLSEERNEWPDIDLDLPSGDRRERVIQYVYERYGKLGAAMTANVITYRSRSAAREVGKTLDIDEELLGRLSAAMHSFEWHDPNDTPERRFQAAGFDTSDPRIKKFFDLFLAIKDMPRHLGQHSGGMVIAQGALDSVVPLEPASMPGRVVVQWDKDDCADMRIVKVDLLGLGMMALLEEALVLIRESYGEHVDLSRLPADDPAVYAALQKADTVGMFQVESRAQMACLPRIRPERFYDLVVQVGIIRPGPIVGKMVHPYIQRRLGREPADCIHPSFEPVLKRTLGVPLFQEQLIRLAMIAASFSGGEAEELRRSFSHKRSQTKMKEIEARLRCGMEQNGLTGAVQDTLVLAISSFALYGFPESHAASFALIAYASAYLKTHYLAAFTAALLNNQPMGFYSPATIVKDAQRHGLRIRPVDVTCSQWFCTLETCATPNMRLGLCYVRGLRKQAGEAIVQARPFTSVEDLARRVPELHKDEMTRLAEVGALNWIGAGDRRNALWQAEQAVRRPGELFEELEPEPSACPLQKMTSGERLDADYSGTGLTLSRHPMAFRRAEMQRLGVLRAMDLLGVRNGRLVRVAGNVIVRQRPGTAKGFLFLSLEDETGIANVIVMPDLFERFHAPLVREPFLLVTGVLQKQDGAVSVKARRVEALATHFAAQPSRDFR
jgi:error-prone DNA polymerase